MSRKILLTGATGQVGWELRRSLACLGEVIAVDRGRMDLADAGSIRRAVQALKPDFIVNPAAYTAVDRAEAEPDLARAINTVAPGVLAEEAKELGALLVHYSTDYVFDGTKDSPYTEDDAPNPLSVYGRTKWGGEEAIRASGAAYFILRTSWVYGLRGANFLLTMQRLMRERPELKIVDDQVGAPTWSRMIAEATAQALAQIFSPLTSHASPLTDLSGTYHLSSAGETSWFGFAEAIAEVGGIDPRPRLIPIPSSGYPTPARRPANSRLSNSRFEAAFGLGLPDWRQGLRLCLDAA